MLSPRKLAVFCSGQGSNFEAVARAIRRGRLRAGIALMVCDNPGAYALKRAARHGIPVCLASPPAFGSRGAWEKFLIQILKNQKVELVILAGFMRVLSPYFIRAYRNRILNIHPSYLPAFKGAHAIRDALRAGVGETGVTVHVVTEKVDSGPILLREKVKILRTDTLKTLETRIHKVEHRLYPEAISRYILLKGNSWQE